MFSAFAALTSTANDIALGALLGAGLFVAGAVIGLVTLVKPFNVQAKLFMRDCAVYLVGMMTNIICHNKLSYSLF